MTASFFSCENDKPESALKGCCGNDAIEEAVGNGHVYVPNIFTPNDDGINDKLYISTDSIQLIVEVEIRDSDGKIIYKVYDPSINSEEEAWDGRVDSVVVEGLYTLFITVVAEDGTNQRFTGKVCNFPCDGISVTEKVSSANCQFPVQSDDGYFCHVCPSGEPNDCFE